MIDRKMYTRRCFGAVVRRTLTGSQRCFDHIIGEAFWGVQPSHLERKWQCCCILERKTWFHNLPGTQKNLPHCHSINKNGKLGPFSSFLSPTPFPIPLDKMTHRRVTRKKEGKNKKIDSSFGVQIFCNRLTQLWSTIKMQLQQCHLLGTSCLKPTFLFWSHQLSRIRSVNA